MKCTLGFRARLWRKMLVIGAAIATAGAMMRSADAMITLQETTVPIDATLQTDGWMGVKLTLVADAASGNVGGMDFKNNIDMNGYQVVNGVMVYIGTGTAGVVQNDYLWPAGEPIGISGPIHQAWNVVAGDPDVEETPGGNLGAGADLTDSFFLNTPQFTTEDAFDEDNNLATGGSAGNFTASPLTDTLDKNGNGVDYGVGSLMTFSGIVDRPLRQQSMDIAFLIIPAGGNDVTIRGVVLDPNADVYPLEAVLNPSGFSGSASFAALVIPSPEPGSVGLAAVGGAALIARRRKRVR